MRSGVLSDQDNDGVQLQEEELEKTVECSDLEIESDDGIFLDLNSSAIDVLQDEVLNYGGILNEAQIGDNEESQDDISSCEDCTLEDLSDGSESEECPAKAKKRKKTESFFSTDAERGEVHNSFIEYKISRPILKAINELKFHKPTPVQARVLPLAMKGRDLCVSAITGSGKTAAFVIPILERLTYKDSMEMSVIRILILTPTRELAVQCHDVIRKISRYTNIQSVLCIGGTDSKIQNAQLIRRPDIVVGTPGRIIDHLTNTPCFSLDALEILIIDEADKMLEVGFSDELDEIINNIPKNRQTLLFSATMTDSVERLVKLSLKKPIKLFINSITSLPATLTQEFVRIKSGKEEHKLTSLLTLCIHSIKNSTIVFFNEKFTAHKAKILFDLCKHPAIEFHGNLSQKRRLEALNDFRNRKCNLLLSTDVAARGLDILSVKNVINYDMPKNYSQYVHRVGRTARANANGRSISLVCEVDRKIVKLAIDNSTSRVKHRVLDTDLLNKYRNMVEFHKDDVVKVLKEEKVQKNLDVLQMDVQKAKNMIEHRDEIFRKPQRKWFKSSQKKTLGKPSWNRNNPGIKRKRPYQKNTPVKNRIHK